MSLKNVDIKDVDEILYFYLKDHNKKFNHYLLKGEFKLVFNNNQDCKHLITCMNNITTIVSWSDFLREAIDSLKEERYDFIYIAEMDIIPLAQKRDLTYDFYLKHNMTPFEWKREAMIDKDKNLTNKLPQNLRQPISTKFDCYRNNII